MGLTKQRLLVVDHEAVIATSIQRKLIDEGYDVPAIAQSVEEALQKVEALRPDLVLTDITLSGPSDGIEAAQLIRDRFDVHVVYVSADADLVENAKSTEPYGYILKPISDCELRIVVEMALKRKQQDAIQKRQMLQQTTLAVFGAFALSDPTEDELFAKCLDAIVKGICATATMLFEAVPGGKELQLRGLAGFRARPEASPIVPVGQLRDTMETGRPGVIQGKVSEAQLLKRSIAEDRELGVGICVRIQGHLGSSGIIVAFANELSQFSAHDIAFLRSLGTMLAGAVQRKIIEADLRQSAQLAEKANQEKSAFLANMSHEIRTPLGVVLGFSELLANNVTNASDSERLNFISIIKRNGQLLSMIINDILDLAKIEAGKLAIERIDVPLADLIEDVAGTLKMQAKAKAIALEISVDANVPDLIRSDPTRLRQILLNVIGNSIKFTTRGSVKVLVRFQCNLDGSRHIHFEVKDTGCGIDISDAPKLFTPFTQADESTTRKFGGTGLGLALSKRLAQALGGDVILMESAPGVGSTFKITIDPGEIIQEGTIASHGNDQLKFADTKKVFSPRGKLEGLNILLVEDDPDHQILISRLLSIAGAKVELADNGRDGLEKALVSNYDAILMDIQLPVMDGYASTAALRKKGYTNPIIAVTARAMIEERERCLASGFTNHVAKPVDRDDLLGKLLTRSTPINHV